MAKQDDNKGCFLLIMLVVIVGVVIWAVSSIGHVLDLTPTYSELMDSPDGYVPRHYKGVVIGYILTLFLIIGAFLVLGMSFVELRSPNTNPRALATIWGTWGALLIVALILPVGARSASELLAAAPTASDFVGQTADQAEAQAEARGLRLAWEAKPERAPEKCRVTQQSVKPGQHTLRRVRLACVVTIPSSLKGSDEFDASAALSERGLESKTAGHNSTGYDCKVRTWRPERTSPPGAIVELIVRCRDETEPSPPAEDVPSKPATDNPADYSGLSCDDIGHSYSVVPGSDPEHDANNDGYACESQ